MDSFGWWSLLPPVAAIVLAIATRRVVASLLAGVFAGSLLLTANTPDITTWKIPFVAFGNLLEGHLWANLIEPDHLRVFAFTLLMGAMVGVVHRSGGMLGVVDLLTPWAKTRRGGQLVTWVLGLVVFFDDYANTLLLGGAMQPLTDRLRISREKLAYLVDSTAAPVSGLALISTWIAGEIGFIEDGCRELTFNGPADGYQIFVASIPYRFYVLWALLFIPIVAWLGRDFGPMLRAERRAKNDPPENELRNGNTIAGAPSARNWWDAALPVCVMVLTTFALLVATGWKAVEAATVASDWIQVVGKGDSYFSLLYGSLAGLFTAVVLTRTQRTLTAAEMGDAAKNGALLLTPALAILWLSWTLSELTDEHHLQTGPFLAGLLQEKASLAWMPSLVFLLASLVAFCTGTSWGTMGILMPLAIPAVHGMLAAGGPVDANDPIFLASVGGVLAGAIFGDHCSPISDTTVLSSQASGCDHIAHVRTQLPYALLVGAVSVACGTLPAGYGFSPWLLFPVGLLVLGVSLRLIGRPAEAPSSGSQQS